MESKKVEFFNKLSFTTILATLFISLFFFIPYIPVTLDASKGFLVSIGMTLALFFWLIARLGEGKFLIPKDKIIIFASLIPIVFLISSFFSSSKYVSLFGSGFEIGTFGSVLVLFILFFLSSIYFQTERRLWSFYRVMFLGAVILAVFELINIFVGFGRFAPGLLNGISSGNLVGSWNDFVLFFGLIVLLSLFTIEFLKNKGLFLVMQYFLLVVGLFFLIIINLPLVWVMVGLFSIIIFVYSISIQQAGINIIHDSDNKKKFPFTALIVVFICLIFLVGNNSIGGLITRYINVPNTSVRPLITTTSEIALKAIKHNPLLGTGPNTFNLDWALWQPKAIAQSQFWNIDFSNGYSSLLTFAVTTGLLGIFAWLLFLVTVLLRGIKSLNKVLRNSLSNYFTMTALMTAIYSWTTIIFYTPNIIMFVIAFISSGMIIGILVYHQSIKVRSFSFLGDPRNSFFSILGLMVLMMITLSTTYVYAEKFASIIYFSKGSTSNATDLASLSKSEKMLSNALLLDQNDIYYRTISQIYLAEMSVMLNDKTISKDTLKSNIQQLVSLAQQSAQLAINQNPNQYQNYVNLGNIDSSLLPLSVQNSYENAVINYNKAQALAPNNPSIALLRASLEIANKSNDEARKYIANALAIKPNYTDAMFLLAQIETDEGNPTAAIADAENASQAAPNDPTVFFKLGLLRYNNSDYQGAISAFEQSISLDPSNVNAHFLLGQSYKKVGRTDDAMAQFKLLSQALPDNQDVKDAINSISNPSSSSNTTPPTNLKTSTNTTTKAQKLPLPVQH
ncbi:MAG: tetratricopeptide repeat protein [Patescibacteria group bacterium]|nr:tetratricopeptide repeat protein [Patescibacteria group bacterium]